MSLAGKTAFITGGSRGIGKAIALKLAKHGANIVIAAKTVNPHPILPGTIYSAVDEIVNVGGRGLACELDIRDESAIKKALKSAVDNFGGIDILINNASAISLSNVESLESKKLDLMLNINIRGTLLCIKHCIKYLLNSSNPHVINLSPPVPLDLNWYKNHAAYTISKAAMSHMIAGFSEDYKNKGIAFNTLWPKTAIKTAAIEMLLKNDEKLYTYCRRPEIMADAAYEIVKKDSTMFTKNFCIDEDFLKENGINDFSVYNYVENPTLMEDLFVGKPSEKNNFAGSNGGNVDLFKKLNQILPKLKENNKIKFSIKLLDLNQIWTVDFNSDSPQFMLSETSCETLLTGSSQVFGDILHGGVDPMMAYSAGNLGYIGDPSIAISIIQLINKIKNEINSS